jgi:hypothetical protein
MGGGAVSDTLTDRIDAHEVEYDRILRFDDPIELEREVEANPLGAVEALHEWAEAGKAFCAVAKAAEWVVCPNRNRNEVNDEGAYNDLNAALAALYDALGKEA